jgi:hypothetical protein
MPNYLPSIRGKSIALSIKFKRLGICRFVEVIVIIVTGCVLLIFELGLGRAGFL